MVAQYQLTRIKVSPDNNAFAPIALFVYNRPWHTRQTVEALQKNELAKNSDLFIFSDASKSEKQVETVSLVRKYIRQINGFKSVSIIERDKNLGLANSIIDGVTRVISDYGKVIVLEDDLVTSPYFLEFMNQCLDMFEKRLDIFSITGFSFDSKFMNFPSNYNDNIYLNIRPMSWSWATWKDRWQGIDWEVRDFQEFITNSSKVNEFNKGGTDLSHMLTMQMEGKLDSWYIRWCYHAYLNKKLTIYPKISFVNNLGHDNTGTHCGVDKNNIYSHKELCNSNQFSLNMDIAIDDMIVKNFNKAFNIKFKGILKQKVKKILGF
ncbi:MAG: glycosyltransferase [Methylobacter sp.]|nr:glycosyltransferase [Methylobacter sp.]